MKQIFYIGPDHGTASALKLAVNINIALIALALAEGMVFARGTGVEIQSTFVKILNSTSTSRQGKREIRGQESSEKIILRRSL